MINEEEIEKMAIRKADEIEDCVGYEFWDENSPLELFVSGFINGFLERSKDEEVKELQHTLDIVTAEWNKERDELRARCKAVSEVNEKMKCCGNCKKERNKPEPLAVHVSCTKCKDYSEWELAE